MSTHEDDEVYSEVEELAEPGPEEENAVIEEQADEESASPQLDDEAQQEEDPEQDESAEQPDESAPDAEPDADAEPAEGEAEEEQTRASDHEPAEPAESETGEEQASSSDHEPAVVPQESTVAEPADNLASSEAVSSSSDSSPTQQTQAEPLSSKESIQNPQPAQTSSTPAEQAHAAHPPLPSSNPAEPSQQASSELALPQPSSQPSEATESRSHKTESVAHSTAYGSQAGVAPTQRVIPQQRYTLPTQVMPKGPLQEYTNVNQDTITFAFSPATSLGIRSLPDAMGPGFREALYWQLIDQHAADREEMRMGSLARSNTSPAHTRLAYTLPGGLSSATSVPLPAGQRPVTRVHPYDGLFTTYEYQPSEYDRARLATRFEQLQARLAQVTPSDFVVRAPPVGPKGTPAFCEFSYYPEPCLNQAQVQLQEDNNARAAALGGPFVMPGRAQSPANLRSRADPCMMALCKQLTDDWPASFMQVFEDKTGAIVVSFDRAAAVLEGDLSMYMQNMAKNHWLTLEYRLTKDGSQWGLEDADTNAVFYLFWPPWVRHRFVGMPTKHPAAATEADLAAPHKSSTGKTGTAGSRAGSNASLPTTLLQFESMSALSRSAAKYTGGVEAVPVSTEVAGRRGPKPIAV